MRIAITCFLCCFTLFTAAYGQKKDNKKPNSFNFSVIRGSWIPGTNFSRICDWVYIINDSKVEVHYRYMDSGVVNKHSKNINNDGIIDSLVYEKPLKKSDSLKAMSNFNFEALQSDYSIPEPPIDGFHFTIYFKKGDKQKDVSVNDKYAPEIEKFFTQLNKFLPQEWKFYYSEDMFK